MRGLHRLLYHPHQIVAQGVQIRLVSELGGEGFEGLSRVIFAAVEALVYEPLDTASQGHEQRSDREGGDNHREGGLLAGKDDEEPLQQNDAAEVEGNQRGRQRTVDESAVDDEIDLVEPVARYSDPHGDRDAYQADQNKCVSNPSEPHQLQRFEDDVLENGTANCYRGSIGEPLGLQALYSRRVQPSHQQRGYSDGYQNKHEHLHRLVSVGQALYPERVANGREAEDDLTRREGRQNRSHQRQERAETCEPPPTTAGQPPIGEQKA